MGQLGRGVARHDRPEHLVHDGGEDTGIVVTSQLTVDLENFVLVRLVHHTERQVHGLEVYDWMGLDGVIGLLALASSGRLDGLWPGADIVDDWALDHGHLEVPSFTHYILLHAGDGAELKGTVTGFNYAHCVISDKILHLP